MVERGAGRVTALTFETDESTGCVSETGRGFVTEEGLELNHGIDLSGDGGTLFASSQGTLYRWEYDADGARTGNRQEVIANMSGSDHSTRTIVAAKHEGQEGWVVVGRGSLENLDLRAASLSEGSSQVKAFELDHDGVYDYASEGRLLGWGLRNEVGLAEHPVSGGIWGVENSADQLRRHGVDVHARNPGEELNFLGYLNGTETEGQGTNFGYPWCFSAWDVSELPENGGMEVGTQFAIDENEALGGRNETDAFCKEQTRSRLVFESHMAPLDIVFNDTGRQAWISFHGSWNSPDPTGYKLSVVEFDERGEPVDEMTSTTAAKDVFFNEDVSRCNEDCFRPVGVAFDAQGRVFMSSDSTGEVYVVSRDEGTEPSPSASGAPDATTTGSQASGSGNAGDRMVVGWGVVVVVPVLGWWLW